MATLVASYAGQSGATLYAGRFPVASLSGKYRTEQPQLFVDVIASTPTTGNPIVTLARPGVADPKYDYQWGLIGPSYYHVEQTAEWAWVNAGGDWTNTAGTAQGTTLPHFTFTANAVTTGGAVYPSVPFTAAAQAAWARGKWNAFIVRVSGGARSIAALHHATLSAPSVNVNYTDGSSATLACTACVALTTGSAYTQIGNAEASLAQNVALEFQMPTKSVTSATLSINLSQHTSTSATVSGFLANPTVNAEPVVTGLANAYPQDEGIDAHPDVLFAQRFEDGSVLTDFVIASPANVDFTDFDNWSPVVYGGTDDPTKLPTMISGNTLVNKWFQVNTPTAGGGFSLVDSSYTGDGFVPFGPGRGALRTVMPEFVAADGGVVGSGGALGCDLMTMLPKEVCGLLDDIYVRFKMRFHFAPKYLADSKMFRQSGGAYAAYAVPHGKFGPGPHHWTGYGGNSNTAGDNLGWSARLGFTCAPADAPLSGMQPYIHSQDMLPDRVNQPLGKDGGLGAGFYTDQTYEIEVRTKLNTYNAAGAIGTSPRDGICEIWVDGRLDSTHTLWKWRDGAIDYGLTPNGPSLLAPFRELGIAGLCLNNFHGGTLPPDHDLVMFIGDIVAATSYIGPSGVTPPPSWAETVPLTVGTLPSAMTAGSFAVLASGSRSLDFYGGFVGHQGSVYMPAQRAMWYFGAETHSDPNYYTNSPRHIALDTMTMYRDIANDAAPGSYRLDAAGVPYANAAKTRPWGQHAMRQLVRVSASEWVLAYPTTEHANYFGSTAPIFEGGVTSVGSYRRALWFYNIGTAAWRVVDGGASNANIVGFLDGAVGYGITYSASRGSLMGVINGYWRELNLTTFARESSAPVIGAGGYNTYAMLLDSGLVLAGAGGSGSNTTLFVLVDPSNPAAYTSVSKASVAAVSGFSAVNTPWCKLPSGKVVAFLKDQTANQLRAFIYDPATTGWTDTGHTLGVGAVGVADGTYWQQCDYADEFGCVVLSSNINDTLSVWGYKPASGV